jgi:serine/threonine-protein kinase
VLLQRLATTEESEIFLVRPKDGLVPAPRLLLQRLLDKGCERSDVPTLLEEAALDTHIEHPNVVRVYGPGNVDHSPYVALEYLEGLDLERLIRRGLADGHPLSTELCVFIAHQIALGLAAFHQSRKHAGAGLVHGNVSPANVQISLRGEVKLGHVGITRRSTELEAERDLSLIGGTLE